MNLGDATCYNLNYHKTNHPKWDCDPPGTVRCELANPHLFCPEFCVFVRSDPYMYILVFGVLIVLLLAFGAANGYPY